MVWVVQIGSTTRTSACMTARKTFSCAIADSGRTSAAKPANNLTIMYFLEPLEQLPMHKLCKASGLSSDPTPDSWKEQPKVTKVHRGEQA